MMRVQIGRAVSGGTLEAAMHDVAWHALDGAQSASVEHASSLTLGSQSLQPHSFTALEKLPPAGLPASMPALGSGAEPPSSATSPPASVAAGTDTASVLPSV